MRFVSSSIPFQRIQCWRKTCEIISIFTIAVAVMKIQTTRGFYVTGGRMRTGPSVNGKKRSSIRSPCIHGFPRPNDGFVVQYQMQGSMEVFDDLECISDEIEETALGTIDIYTLEEVPFLIQAWLRRGEADRVGRLLQRLVDERNSGNEFAIVKPYIYNMAIAAWAKAGDAERAEGALYRMMEDEVSPNRISFNTCISGWAKSKSKTSGDRACKILDLMVTSGIEPDIITHNSVLDALAKSARFGSNDAALKSVKRLKHLVSSFRNGASSIAPNVISFTSVFDALAHCYDDEAMSIAEDLMEDMLSLADNFGTSVPDTKCFTTLINVSARRKNPANAQALLKQMEKLYHSGNFKVKPNIITFNTVLNSWAKSTHPKAGKKAEYVFSYMESVRNEKIYMLDKPDSYSYNAMIEVWSKAKSLQGAEKSQHWLQRMISECDEGPSEHSYAMVVDAWGRNPQSQSIENAMEVFNMMMDEYKSGSSKLRPTNKIYNTLIKAFSRSKGEEIAERAEAILRRMEKEARNGFSVQAPDITSYSYVISAWANSGHPDAASRANDVLREVIGKFYHSSSNASIGPYNFLSVMKLWAYSSRRDKVRHAMDVHREMLRLYDNGQRRLKPSTQSFTMIINACAFSSQTCSNEKEREENLQIAIDTLETMKKSDSTKPNSITYGTFIKACHRLIDSDCSKIEFKNRLISNAFLAAKEEKQLNGFVRKQLKLASPELYETLITTE